MIRPALLCGLLLAYPGAAQDKKSVPKEMVPFQGSWKVVKAEYEGKDPPAKIPDGLRFRFAGDKLTVAESRNESETGSFRVDPRKDPAEIDMVGPKGEKVPGIYRFTGDGKLSICFARGKDAPRPKSFETKNAPAVLMVMEKAKD